MSKSHPWHPSQSEYWMGTLFLIVNNQPEVCTRMPYNANLQQCARARHNDPFCMVYLRDDARSWHKGEYCYTNQRFIFTPVGMASVPDVIRMMEILHDE